MNRLLRFLLGDRRFQVFYKWDVAEQGPGQFDPNVIELRPSGPLDPFAAKQLRGIDSGSRLAQSLMRRRWRGGSLRCFVLMLEEFPVCTGVVQQWSVRKADLAWLGMPGPYLGPVWTDLRFRGRHLCERLLLHLIHVLHEAGVHISYTTVDVGNAPSRRLFERSRFKPVGVAEVRRYCCRLYQKNRWRPELPTTLAEPSSS